MLVWVCVLGVGECRSSVVCWAFMVLALFAAERFAQPETNQKQTNGILQNIFFFAATNVRDICQHVLQAWQCHRRWRSLISSPQSSFLCKNNYTNWKHWQSMQLSLIAFFTWWSCRMCELVLITQFHFNLHDTLPTWLAYHTVVLALTSNLLCNFYCNLCFLTWWRQVDQKCGLFWKWGWYWLSLIKEKLELLFLLKKVWGVYCVSDV